MAQEQTKIFAEIKKVIRRGIKMRKNQVNISKEIGIAKEKGYTNKQITTYVERNLESLKRKNTLVDYMTFNGQGQEVKISYKPFMSEDEYPYQSFGDWARDIGYVDGWE